RSRRRRKAYSGIRVRCTIPAPHPPAASKRPRDEADETGKDGGGTGRTRGGLLRDYGRFPQVADDVGERDAVTPAPVQLRHAAPGYPAARGLPGLLVGEAQPVVQIQLRRQGNQGAAVIDEQGRGLLGEWLLRAVAPLDE